MVWTYQKQKILRKDGKNTQKNYMEKIFMTQITTKIHLKPDSLECKVKWALGNIVTDKGSGGDGIPAELFQILKYAVKVLHSIRQEIWKIQQWPQD